MGEAYWRVLLSILAMLSEQMTGRIPARDFSAGKSSFPVVLKKSPLRRNSPKGAMDIAREVQLD